MAREALLSQGSAEVTQAVFFREVPNPGREVISTTRTHFYLDKLRSLAAQWFSKREEEAPC